MSTGAVWAARWARATRLLTLGVFVAPGLAGQARVTEFGPECREGDREAPGWFCEVREFTLGSRDRLSVDATPNGGIKVRGWDRDVIQVLAVVTARARSDEDAEGLVKEVLVSTDHAIHASGPPTGRRESWWVSYVIAAPRGTALSLMSLNGGITIGGMRGRTEFETTNGGVHLEDMAGDVRGRTTNGGLHVELSGSRWDGEGLDVETTNGGVKIQVPPDYSARLETGTVNGGLDLGFPVTVQGQVSRRLTVELGQGGPTIRAVTTNGGVSIRRGSS